MGVVDSDTLLQYGSHEYIQNSSFDSIPLSVNISYLDNIPKGSYQLQVITCDSLNFVGDIKKRVLGKNVTLLNVVSYADSICETCCTNETNGGIRRYKCLVAKELGDVVGASAQIKTKYGKLCGYGTSTAETVEAQSGAWVGIQDEIDPVQGAFTTFLQMGYMHNRWYGNVIDTVVYIEVRGIVQEGDYIYFPADGSILYVSDVGVPENSSNHTYKVKVDHSDGKLYYYYDNYIIFNLETSFWIDRSTKYVTWQGEINGRESDMPGTFNDPCIFMNCKFTHKNSSSEPVVFGADEIVGFMHKEGVPYDDWGIWIDTGTSTFKIWDNVLLQ